MMAYLVRKHKNPVPKVDMKLRETGRAMSLPELGEAGKNVKTRKPNALPPKTKTIKKFSKGGPTQLELPFQTNDKLRIKGDADLLFKDVTYDADLGQFVNKKTGETGTLDYFRDKEIYSAEEAVEKVFEPIADKLKQRPRVSDKGIGNRMVKKVSKTNGNGNDNVVPIGPIPHEKPWYEQERKTISDQTVEEYLAEKEIEYRKNLQTNLVKEALRLGIGKLLR
jgi:hypothetical protein